MRLLPALLIVAVAAGLAGCPKKPTTVPDAGEATASQDHSTTGTGDGRVGEARDLPAEGAAVGAAPAGVATIIYFDFDRSDIRPEFAGLISAHARHLAGAAGTRVRLEGHTDERGSREYNIALGERRAQAVRRALMLQGAADNQLTTVSYGEERPAVEGSDEAAYERNRRVEIVYGR
ncbi:MAG: peptidoglycan-associated lipoprotein Pal [Steroidobacteraceae bacterium]|nr:peptidoglycan-associated lipoprotein Pal [Steroidobacteraceae bacterium]